MKIRFAHLADYAFRMEDGKLGIVGVFDIIRVRQFPAVHPRAYVAFGVTTESSDSGEIPLSLVVESPDGDEMARFTMALSVEDHDADAQAIIPMSQMIFPAAGIYRFMFSVDGRQALSLNLNVVQIESSEKR